MSDAFASRNRTGPAAISSCTLPDACTNTRLVSDRSLNTSTGTPEALAVTDADVQSGRVTTPDNGTNPSAPVDTTSRPASPDGDADGTTGSSALARPSTGATVTANTNDNTPARPRRPARQPAITMPLRRTTADAQKGTQVRHPAYDYRE
ncbi:hypothetical protein TPCV2_13670 [Cutibacterium avidum]|nr:hypothetical protein TPCV4_20660 [Cutibacterium avidum]